MPPHNVYRNGRVHVQREMCSTCIFRPGNLMHLRSGRVKGMIEETKGEDGATIICHQTLDATDNAVCRGFYDRHADDDIVLRTAKICHLITEVEPEIDVAEKMTEADAHE